MSKKRALVLGSGKSGCAAARLLVANSFHVTITDDRWLENNLITLPEALRKEQSLEFATWQRLERIPCELAIISPGLDPRSPKIIELKKRYIPFLSELELGSLACTRPIIAITGTNGKTTVTEMVTAVLNNAGLSAYPVGNIGEPLCDFVLSGRKADYLVCEVSSFQLEHSPTFKPSISAVLNISEDHLDRYDSFQQYALTKWSIHKNHSSGDAIFVSDDLKENCPWPQAVVVRVHSLPIRKKNEAFSGAITSYIGVSKMVIQTTLEKFPDPPHRREKFLVHNGVTFINDSKCTNCHALENMLSEISGPVILIAGGRNKEMDFSVLENLIHSKVKHLILMGETRYELANVWHRTAHTIVDNIEEAAENAINLSKQGDTVLFSPACSSLDQFSDYKHRGNSFKEAICKRIMKTTN